MTEETIYKSFDGKKWPTAEDAAAHEVLAEAIEKHEAASRNLGTVLASHTKTKDGRPVTPGIYWILADDGDLVPKLEEVCIRFGYDQGYHLEDGKMVFDFPAPGGRRRIRLESLYAAEAAAIREALDRMDQRIRWAQEDRDKYQARHTRIAHKASSAG